MTRLSAPLLHTGPVKSIVKCDAQRFISRVFQACPGVCPLSLTSTDSGPLQPKTLRRVERRHTENAPGEFIPGVSAVDTGGLADFMTQFVAGAASCPCSFSPQSPQADQKNRRSQRFQPLIPLRCNEFHQLAAAHSLGWWSVYAAVVASFVTRSQVADVMGDVRMG